MSRLLVASLRLRPHSKTRSLRLFSRIILTSRESTRLLCKQAVRDLTSLTARLRLTSVSCAGRGLIIATGGDDNAVGVSLLAFSASSPDSPLNAALIAQTSLSDAHASTIQGTSPLGLLRLEPHKCSCPSRSRAGLDFLSPSLLASFSVEQRLNCYTLSSAASLSAPTLTLKLHDSTCLDVADCSAQAVVAGAEGVHRLVVAGIGAEVIDVSVQQ